MEVELVDIPKDRCQPELRGMVISYHAANVLLDGIQSERRACAEMAIDLDASRKVAAVLDKQIESERTWAIFGKVSVGVMIFGAVLGGSLAIAKVAGGI